MFEQKGAKETKNSILLGRPGNLRWGREQRRAENSGQSPPYGRQMGISPGTITSNTKPKWIKCVV
jgi:hypothetical protein